MPRLWLKGLNPRRKPVLYVTNSLLAWTLISGLVARSYQVHTTLPNHESTDQYPLQQPVSPPHFSSSHQAPQGALAATQLPTLRLPTSDEAWSDTNRVLAESVVPAVLAASTVVDKNTMLCQGIYQLFANQFGCVSS